MKFIITGSGGCVNTPKPLCQCSICVQAREKGHPYSRHGCSLYLEDIGLLIDTPEDICDAINATNIKYIDNIMYSHWHPDHTLGMRIIEQLRLEWLDYYDGIKPQNPINIFALKEVMNDLNAIGNKFGSFLDFYESMSLIKRVVVEQSIIINDIKITLVPVKSEHPTSIFIFESKDKKLVYAPCDCFPFPSDEIIKNADILVIGNTVIGYKLKNEKVITKQHPMFQGLHNMEQIINIAKNMNIDSIIITHIEEDWSKSYDDYLLLEKQYSNLKFAFDKMIIEL